MLPVDRHAWTNRWRRHHPLEKAAFALGLMVVDFALPAPSVAPPVLVAAFLATVVGAAVPVRAFVGVMAVPAGFLLAGVPALALSVDFGASPMVSLSAEGVHTAVTVTLRSLAAVACLAFLILTTPVPDLLGLARRAGVPAALVELAYLIHRLIFVVLERADAARQAQNARLGYRSWKTAVRSVGLLAGGLFLRSLDRGRRLDIGLTARGYRGDLRVLGVRHALSPLRCGLSGLVVAGVAAIGALT